MDRHAGKAEGRLSGGHHQQPDGGGDHAVFEGGQAGGVLMRIILAQPRGFCAGVVRAIDIVERALDKYGAPVYVRHEIVHNRHVVETLKAKGARFVEELDEVPDGAVTVFSAHGVSRRVEATPPSRGLPVLDATCPLVAKVHTEGRRYVAQGRAVILIGHAGHPEVEGTMGQVPGEVHLVAAPPKSPPCLSRPTGRSPMSPRPRCRSTTPRR